MFFRGRQVYAAAFTQASLSTLFKLSDHTSKDLGGRVRSTLYKLLKTKRMIEKGVKCRSAILTSLASLIVRADEEEPESQQDVQSFRCVSP